MIPMQFTDEQAGQMIKVLDFYMQSAVTNAGTSTDPKLTVLLQEEARNADRLKKMFIQAREGGKL